MTKHKPVASDSYYYNGPVKNQIWWQSFAPVLAQAQNNSSNQMWYFSFENGNRAENWTGKKDKTRKMCTAKLWLLNSDIIDEKYQETIHFFHLLFTGDKSHILYYYHGLLEENCSLHCSFAWLDKICIMYLVTNWARKCNFIKSWIIIQRRDHRLLHFCQGFHS